MKVLLKSVKIIDVANKGLHLKKRDILINDGTIEKIGVNLPTTKNTKTITFKNLHVSIGWFDSSVCFGEPGYEERETISNGLTVAAKSGFTDIVLNPNINPLPDSSSDIVFLKNMANGSATNLYPLGTLTVNGEGQKLAELYDMGNAGAVGFYDFKKSVENSNLMKISLQYARNLDGLVHSFPMDMSIAGKGLVHEGETSTRLGLKGIPALAEELRIARDLFILEYTGGKLHIPTISTANAVRLISDAKKKGLDVSCSVALHNLWFTEEVLTDFDSNHKVMPPLRTKKDSKALLKGLKDGVIDFVTSDHTPMNIEEKRVEFDNAAYGTIGIESAFGILNQLVPTEMAVTLLTKGRERYGIEEPLLKEGNKACLTLFDPDATFQFGENDILSTSKNTMFLGQPIKGKVYGVICNGKTII
ncbi:dihydroorotase [Spongiimicrobium sp. 3-5]|uniref:dihydroorotase n=1 Tax=Spongiimicrobium sp. 3-5 TaxID=3332596 RepID=UPI0039812BC9